MTTSCQLYRLTGRRSTDNRRDVQLEFHFNGLERKFDAPIHRAIHQTRLEQSRNITVNSLYVTPDAASRFAQTALKLRQSSAGPLLRAITPGFLREALKARLK